MNSKKDNKTETFRADSNSAMIYTFNNRFFSSLTYEDVLKIKNWRNQQMQILRQWKPLTDFNQEQWFEKISTDPTQLTFSIHWLNSSNELELIGYCGIVNIDYINRRGEISFIVEPTRTENIKIYNEDFNAALQLLCSYAFSKLNFIKLYTETYSLRENHISVLENFGFQYEGSLRNHQFIDGKLYDSKLHSILKEEWIKKEDSKHVF